MARDVGERVMLDDVQRERREMESLVEAVRTMFHRHRTAKANGAARLLESLDELLEHLGMLFALQETDGYLLDRMATRARLGEDLGALKTEHATLFEGLSRMIELCDRDVARGRWEETWKLAEMTFENFCERLHDHEVFESEQSRQAFD